MICNAGGVTKRDVGRIRIDDTDTRFEISADKAAGYAAQIKQPGSVEKGIRIAPAGKMPEEPRQAKTKLKQDGKPSRKHQSSPADRGKAAKHKARKPKRHA
ncbi:DbpA RNA binding domain-containing protein [Martelella mangrovi]|uniref:ATP-dependent RNA helicase DeaD n=1 Tax=Martelella mangrovi TaxID=1397477 RepID=A0ABV2IGS3_9HYPH